MTVSPTSSATAASSSSSSTAAQAATINYNQYLQLLVAELQNQDPTAPTDPTQYMSQLASFSSVEQQIQTNSKLDDMLTSSALTQAELLIGQTITSADGSTTGTVASVNFPSAGAVSATLTDGSTVALTTGSSAGTSTTLSDGSTFTLPDRRHDRVNMNEADALELTRSAIWTVLVVTGPAVGAAMVVGIIVALFQALDPDPGNDPDFRSEDPCRPCGLDFRRVLHRQPDLCVYRAGLFADRKGLLTGCRRLRRVFAQRGSLSVLARFGRGKSP